MTSNAQRKGFWGLSRPLLLEQALQFSVPMLDTLFLSMIADTAAAAAGALAPVLFFTGNILWVTVFAGASIANQRLGAGKNNRAISSIWIAVIWVMVLSGVLSLLLYWLGPTLISWMGLTGDVAINAEIYLAITALLPVLWAAKALTQAILNMYGLPQWNLTANAVYFAANLVANSAVVWGWFGLPATIEAIAWASVMACSSGVLVSIMVIRHQLPLPWRWRSIRLQFRNVSCHLSKIAAPSSIEPISFDLNMVVLNSLAAKISVAALTAKVYTFNIFLVGVIIAAALTTATQILVAQYVGQGQLDKAARQFRYSLKVALLGTGTVASLIALCHEPVMDWFTDDRAILAGAAGWFALAALSEPGRTTNIQCGQNLRALGDGWYIAYTGLAFTWLIALPIGVWLTFYLDWGLLGLLSSAVIDESGRAIIFYRRWQQGHWRQSHIHATEQR